MIKSSYVRIAALTMIVLMLSLPVAIASELNLIYDANGNLVTGDSFYREYNELNQLSVVREGNTSSGQILQEYTWHPVEERILVKRVYDSGSLKEKIVYVNDNFVQVINSSGVWNETYVKQGGILVAQKTTDNEKQAIHPDHLGSIDTITDATGSIIQNNFFSPFGEPIEEGNSRFGYEGKEFDDQTQDTDFHFRKYRPEWGRFTQPDTLLPNRYDPQMLNRYTFERNNPLGKVDETGHLPVVPVIIGVSALIGGIANTVHYYASHENTNIGDAALYFTSGAVAGGAAAVGAIGGVGLAAAAAVAFAGGVAGELIEGAAADIAIEDNVAGLITSGALNAVGGAVGGKLFPTKALNKNIANMKDVLKLFSTTSGNKFLSNTAFGETIATSFAAGLDYTTQSSNFIRNYQESSRQKIIEERRKGSYSGGSGYKPGAGAYVTEEGRVYPTKNKNFRPKKNVKRVCVSGC